MKKLTYLMASLFVFFNVNFVLAQGLVGKCGTEGNGPCSLSDIGPAFKNGLNFALSIAVMLIVIMVIYTGIKVMTSKGNAGELNESKKRLVNVVLGATLIAIAASVVFYVAVLKTVGIKDEFLNIFKIFSQSSFVETAYAQTTPIKATECKSYPEGTSCVDSSGKVGVCKPFLSGSSCEVTTGSASSSSDCPSGKVYDTDTGQCLDSIYVKSSTCGSFPLHACVKPDGSKGICQDGLCTDRRINVTGIVCAGDDIYDTDTGTCITSALKKSSIVPTSEKSIVPTDSNMLPNITGVTDLYDFLLLLIRAVIRWFVFPVIIFFWMYSGFLFVYAQGKPEKLNEAKKVLLVTLIGTVIIMMAESFAHAFRGTIDQIFTK